MKFTKMHGCGNDYIYINGFEYSLSEEEKRNLVPTISNRHFGVGGDGVIFINPSPKGDFEMEMFNADGSRGEMCGNGIRCVAQYVFEKEMTDKTTLDIISCGISHQVKLILKDNHIEGIRVNMGEPWFKPEEIPMLLCQGKERVVNEILEAEGKIYFTTCLSMGNPHTVIFADDISKIDLETIGPQLEKHIRFPNRTNVEFVQILNRDCIRMRVWERGAGETLACGTGACAAVVAGVLNGLTNLKVTVKLLGGQLFVEWNKSDNQIYLTGSGETVFEGDFLK